MPTAESEARRIADLLTESLDPAHAVCAASEAPTGGWQVEVHFVAPLDAAPLRSLVAVIAGRDRAKTLRITPAPARDWVATSLAGLPPVHAGRFIVYGAHDRARVPVNRIAIEIEAALAFGTGHHGTTRGCLLAIDAIAKSRKYLPLKGGGRPRSGRVGVASWTPPRITCGDPALLFQGRVKKRSIPSGILDLGTGSGVLAIAAAKILRTRVVASDIDRRAVRIARTNARNNHVGNLIETVHAAGFAAPRLAQPARFNLVSANILLEPLQRLAAPLARKLAPGARIVLSGLLLAHGNATLAAYRAQGLALERRIVLEGWVTLVMKRPAGARR